MALLGKWCWRLREERDMSLYRILAARYGKVGVWICVGGRLYSVWWKNPHAISEGVCLGQGIGSWIT